MLYLTKRFDKYFWDGNENLSGEFKLKRILEYASFPDLIHFPVSEMKEYLPKLDIDKLRTGQKRKDFIKLIKPYVDKFQSWDEIFKEILLSLK